MANSGWPSVGLQGPNSSIPQHASSIRLDIENLHRHIAQGAETIPSETFLQFSFSILDFTDKILNQPSSTETWTLINHIDQNVKVILEKFLESDKTESLEKQKWNRGNPLVRESEHAFVGDTGVAKNEPSDANCTIGEASSETQEEQTWILGYRSLLDDHDDSEFADEVNNLPGTTSEKSNDFPMQEQGWLLDLYEPLAGTEEEPINQYSTSSTEYFRDTQGGEDVSNLCSLSQGSTDLEEAKETRKLEHLSSYGPIRGSNILQSNAISSNRGSSEVRTSKIVLPSQNPLNGSIHAKIYKPLDTTKNEIRIVRILADADPDYDIGCELSVVSLDDRSLYRALSYTWGAANDTLPIRLNGHRFEVTRNLKRALQRLRAFDTEIPIWIDAICINQTDIIERMYQVQLMRYIFESPMEVIVYLGEPQTHQQTMSQQLQDETWDATLFDWETTPSDIMKVNTILKYGQAYADSYPDLPDERTPNTFMLAMCFTRLLAGDVHLRDISLLANTNIQTECLNAFKSIAAQAWWNRIWCVQEVILPPKVTVLYGRFTAPFQMYIDAAENLERHISTCCKDFLSFSPEQSTALNDYRQKVLTIAESGRLWQERAMTTLITLLRFYYPKDATNPRDKIYGLLGLVREWGRSEPISPNYSISVRRLFEEVALCSIVATNTLECLTFKAERILEKAQFYDDIATIQQGGKPPVTWNLSSWAPDWTKISDRDYERPVAERINRALVFNACGGRPALLPKPLFTACPHILTSSAVLTVSAYRIGKVKNYEGNSMKYMMPFTIHQSMGIDTNQEFPLPLHPTKSLKRPYVAGGTRYDAICRAICGDTFFTSASTSSASRFGNATMFRRTTVEDVESVKLWRKWMHTNKPAVTGSIHPLLKDFTSQESYERVSEADRAIRSVGFLRRFVELDSGHVGMTADASADDEVMIFMGAKTPFTVKYLREMMIKDVGMRKIYVLAGECYLVGAMDGGLADEMEKQGKQPEEVYII
ncbi:heterokaryon incompatibility protein-domain-containing protein [Pyrenochaeta sp. MPI-SDFR-AT-0127]|nr:heterokaryon incompatibility protein-domain-containing protein [Pyrenochaeta sp. MPI-SDFR-AT-0127]